MNDFTETVATPHSGRVGVPPPTVATDGDGSPAYYRTCVKRALNRLRNRPELQKTLRLVVKNGNRREDSMWEILASGRCPTWDAAKTLYWTHLKKMLNIFCGQ